MPNPRRLIQIDGYLKIPFQVCKLIYSILRRIIPAKPANRDRLVVIKLMGMGTIIKLISIYEKHQVDLKKVAICTFDQNAAICQALGLENLILIRTDSPFSMIGDVFRSFQKIMAYHPRFLVGLERGSYALGIYRMFAALFSRAVSIAFHFGEEDKATQQEFLFSMQNRTHADLFLETLPFTPKGKTFVRSHPEQIDSSKIIININASDYVKERRYALSGFREVIVQLSQFNPNFQFYLSGSPAEKEYVDRLMEMLKEEHVNAQNMCGRWSLTDFVTELRSCCLFLTNDSGPMHVGAYLNTPMVVIWGPTRPEHSGYLGNPFIHNIYLNMPCAPCFIQPRSKVGAVCHGEISCMTDLSAKTIANQCLTMIKKTQDTHQWKI